jgi:hypothetical protein
MKTETKTEIPKTETAHQAGATTENGAKSATDPFGGFDPMKPFGFDPMKPFGFDPMKAFAGFDPTKPFGGFDPMKPFGGFDPMAYFAASQQAVRTAVADAQAAATSFAERYAALDPMAYWATFREAMTGVHSRANAVSEQYAQVEVQLVERAQAAVATWAQLAHDAITYGAQLSAEARKLGVEAMRKGATA